MPDDTINCDPAALALAAKCYCSPENVQRAEMIWLMMQIAGLNLTPSELAERSKCFCMDEQSSRAAMLYLTCAAAQAVGA